MNSTTLTGDKAVELIENQLTQHTGGILKMLAQLDPETAVRSWSETIRAVEELINLPGEIDDDVLAVALLSFDLENGKFDPRRLKFILHYLSYYSTSSRRYVEERSSLPRRKRSRGCCRRPRSVERRSAVFCSTVR